MKSVEERIDYDKKIELCKKLGADKFQKVVFKAEELKFRFIRRYCFVWAYFFTFPTCDATKSFNFLPHIATILW